MAHHPQQNRPRPNSGAEAVRRGIVAHYIPKTATQDFCHADNFMHDLLVWEDRFGLLDISKSPMEILRGFFDEDAEVLPHVNTYTRTISHYKACRAKANGPLRLRTQKRPKGFKVDGRELEGVTGLHIPGLHSANIHPGRHRDKVHAVAPKDRKTPRKGPYHASRARAVGFGVGKDHVTIDVATTGQMAASRCERLEQREARYHIPHVEFLKQPRFVLDLIDHFAKQGTMVMGLDLSAGSALSGAGQEVAKLLRKGFRSRKAAGAIEIRMVSTLGRETQEGAEVAERWGADAKSVRKLKSSGLLMCPDCGSMVDVRMNLETGAPVGNTCFCEACNRRVDMGSALAYRARLWSMEDWRKSVLQPDQDALRAHGSQRERVVREEDRRNGGMPGQSGRTGGGGVANENRPSRSRFRGQAECTPLSGGTNPVVEE